MSQNTMDTIVATTRRLAESDPKDEAVERTVKVLEEQIAQLTSEVDKPTGEKNGHGDASRKQDVESLREQINRLRAAAIVPASNYRRIVSILSELDKVVTVASRPQNAPVRAQVASVVQKIAGVFAEIDTTKDLDKPLEEIEKAVHGLYGKGAPMGQSSNSTYYFDRKGRGHHTDGDK